MSRYVFLVSEKDGQEQIFVSQPEKEGWRENLEKFLGNANGKIRLCFSISLLNAGLNCPKSKFLEEVELDIPQPFEPGNIVSHIAEFHKVLADYDFPIIGAFLRGVGLEHIQNFEKMFMALCQTQESFAYMFFEMEIFPKWGKSIQLVDAKGLAHALLKSDNAPFKSVQGIDGLFYIFDTTVNRRLDSLDVNAAHNAAGAFWQ